MLHKVLDIPFECTYDNNSFVGPVIFKFNPRILKMVDENEKISILQWIQIIFQKDSLSLEPLLIFYSKYISSIELLWLFYSFIENGDENEREKLHEKFNEIINRWIELNYQHEWCCLQDETIQCEDTTIKFPLTNIKKEALKIIKNENTKNLINSKFPCNFNEENEENDESIYFKPKLLFEYSASEIVEHLCFKKLSQFKKMKFKELSDCENWNKQRNPSTLTEIIKDFDHLSNAIINTIFKLETPESRAFYISKLIEIAHFSCFNEEFPNFDFAMLINCTLRNSSIYRLKKTWNYVPETEMKKKLEIENLLDLSGGYKLFRSYFKDLQNPCIVYFGIVLTDITFMFDESRNFVENSTDGLRFNINAIRKLHQCILEFIIEPVKKAENIKLTKNIKLQKLFSFLFDELFAKSEWEYYFHDISLTYEARGSTDYYSSSYTSFLCEKILEMARKEKNYFGVKENYVQAILPKSSLEDCFKVLKKLKKRKITTLCLKLQEFLTDCGISYLCEHTFEESMNYRYLLLHFDVRIIFVAKHFKLKDESLFKICDICPIKSFQKSARK